MNAQTKSFAQHLLEIEREAARALELERAITLLKSEKVSLARSRKREIAEHGAWKKEQERDLAQSRSLQLKQKRELQSVTADRERQRIRLCIRPRARGSAAQAFQGA